MRMRFAVALMMAISLLVASLSARASEQIDLAAKGKVIVISGEKDGNWSSRIAFVHTFSDEAILEQLGTTSS